MTSTSLFSPVQDLRQSRIRHLISGSYYDLFVLVLLLVYLLPVSYMVVLAFKSDAQLEDTHAPWYPARRATYTYQGHVFDIYHVPTGAGVRKLALALPGLSKSQFIDPLDTNAALIEWSGDFTILEPYYIVSPTLTNFREIFKRLPFLQMMGDTFGLVLLTEMGVLLSSILVAYGFSRFPLPGGNLLFYVMIATILVPEKVTLLPTFFIYVNLFHWHGTIYPLFVSLFFGNAVFIFLLRQNFKSLPQDLEEAAMLDGAGTLRRLFSVVLPQSWPVIVTITLLQFFYTWNETRLVSLYMGVNRAFLPISFAVQNYTSLNPIENKIEASNIVLLIIPVIILMLSQRFFMRSMIITGMEKK